MKSERNVPKVRFMGFCDDWEKRELGEIADVTKLAGFEFTEHVVYSDEGNIIALRGLNIKNGRLILDDVKYIDNSNFSKLSRSKLYINDIMFTYVGTVGEVAIIEENDRFYLAPNVSRIRVKSDDLPQYISHYMRTDSFYNQVIFPLIATSSQPALSMENIRKFELIFPPTKKEQQQISDYFNNLDHLITLHQRKCETLQKLKKSMLQKMFPKNGSLYPEIRFAGFTDAWEQRKLGELGEISTGSTPSTSNSAYYSEGGIPWVTPTDINALTISDTPRKLSEEGAKVGRVVPANTILCTCIASIGKNTLLTVKGSFNQQINSLTPYDENDAYFLLTESEIWSNIMKRMAASGTMQIVNKTEFSELKTMIPTLSEQQAIGSYFRNLDNLITLHQRKLETLKKLKKAMLQKMFI